MSYNLAGPVLVTHDPTAAVLVTTRRIREGKRFGALEIRVRHVGCPVAAQITCQHGTRGFVLTPVGGVRGMY